MIKDKNRKSMVPLLSLLIPAYENTEGVLRIIKSIPFNTLKNLEVIVSDDSISSKVKDCIKHWNSIGKIQINYVAHESTQNAVDNWNFLLSKANGKYVQLMHHDEWPYSMDYFDKLFDILENSHHDVLILNCILFDSGNIRKHSSFNLKRFVIDKNCNLLLTRNVIGSPSNLVFSSKLDMEFDNSLQWRVDVEFYVRLISGSKSTYVSKDLIVASDLDDRVASITSSNIKPRLKTIKLVESQYLYDTLKYVRPNRLGVFTLFLIHSLEQCFYRVFKVDSYK